MKRLIFTVFSIAIALGAFGLSSYDGCAVSKAAVCPTGCHKVTMEYMVSIAKAVEYYPYHAFSTFATPSPDGGIYTTEATSYKFRHWSGGSTLCDNCATGCLGAGSGNPTQWVTISSNTTCVADE